MSDQAPIGAADIGVLGLAVMGANLARNAARKGFGVALFNRNHERTDKLMAEHGSEGRFYPSKTIEAFVASLAKPRAVIIMVKAGKPVDDMIEDLIGHLEPTTSSSTAATPSTPIPPAALSAARTPISASSAWVSRAARRARSKAPR